MSRWVRLSLPALAVVLGFLPATAQAFQISNNWSGVLCGIVPCTASGGGAAGFNAYILSRVVSAFEIGFVAVAVLVLLFATMNMVIFSSEESAVQQGRLAFVYVIFGAAVVGLARWAVLAFSPSEVGSSLVNKTQFDSALGNIITFIRLVLSIGLVANITIQAVRLVSSQGEQDQVDKAKKRLIAGFVGVALVLLANTIVVSINPQLGNTTAIAGEISGVASYIITLLGFGAVLAVVIAAIMLLVSVDESLRDRAKQLIKGAVIAVVVAMVSYALVTAFISIK